MEHGSAPAGEAGRPDAGSAAVPLAPGLPAASAAPDLAAPDLAAPDRAPLDSGAPGSAAPGSAAPGSGASARPAEGPGRPGTGEPRVDAALRLLDRLPGLPVSEHPELFEQVHAQLTEVLGELDSGAGGPAVSSSHAN